METVVICVLQYMKDDLFRDYSSVLSEVTIELFSGLHGWISQWLSATQYAN